MTTNTSISTYEGYLKALKEMGPSFSQRASEYDQEDRFVSENYEELKAHRFFSMLVPLELGGGGLSFEEASHILRRLAGYCPSTALALSMHQHLAAANVWKFKHGKGGEGILRRIVKEQLVLVSTGAKDWLESNGSLEKVEGGYIFSASKYFASQSAEGDLLVTSGQYEDPVEGAQVFHFAIPFSAPGIELLDDWYTLGMRATGSQTVRLNKVFIPDTAIQLRRGQGSYHKVWNLVLGVAMPLIMSVYVGIAEKAQEMVLAKVRKQKNPKAFIPYLIGEMNNSMTLAAIMLQDMIRINDNFAFQPEDRIGHEILTRKTLIAEACIDTVKLAMEIMGGQGYRRELGLEKLYRDVLAVNYHPLPKREQQAFSAKYLMKEEAELIVADS